MKIVQAGREDAARIALIVSRSNRDVAELFGINVENNPKHPSFYTEDWVISDMDRGEVYFLYVEDNQAFGCVAFEHPRPDTAYLNRLSVLPEHRHKGIGALLVKHIINQAHGKHIDKISLGIIAAHDVLKMWYLGLGFIEKETKQFSHLPFDVTFMHYELL